MRIAGVTLPKDKRLEIALTAIYGIGRPLAHKILDQARVDYGKKTDDLDAEEEGRIRQVVEVLPIEGELRRAISANVKRLTDIQSYRGTRHARRLPSRGQRTKTNSRTRRGNVRKTMGSGRKKLEKK